jgi:hypothetical protein
MPVTEPYCRIPAAAPARPPAASTAPKKSRTNSSHMGIWAPCRGPGLKKNSRARRLFTGNEQGGIRRDTVRVVLYEARAAATPSLTTASPIRSRGDEPQWPTVVSAFPGPRDWTCPPLPRASPGHARRWSWPLDIVALCPVLAAGAGHVPRTRQWRTPGWTSRVGPGRATPGKARWGRAGQRRARPGGARQGQVGPGNAGQGQVGPDPVLKAGPGPADQAG